LDKQFHASISLVDYGVGRPLQDVEQGVEQDIYEYFRKTARNNGKAVVLLDSARVPDCMRLWRGREE